MKESKSEKMGEACIYDMFILCTNFGKVLLFIPQNVSKNYFYMSKIIFWFWLARSFTRICKNAKCGISYIRSFFGISFSTFDRTMFGEININQSFIVSNNTKNLYLIKHLNRSWHSVKLQICTLKVFTRPYHTVLNV